MLQWHWRSLASLFCTTLWLTSRIKPGLFFMNQYYLPIMNFSVQTFSPQFYLRTYFTSFYI